MAQILDWLSLAVIGFSVGIALHLTPLWPWKTLAILFALLVFSGLLSYAQALSLESPKSAWGLGWATVITAFFLFSGIAVCYWGG